MKMTSISLTSSMLIAATLASVAVATEGNTRTDAVPSQARSFGPVIDHALRASPEKAKEDLILTSMRKPTMRNDRKIGDE